MYINKIPFYIKEELLNFKPNNKIKELVKERIIAGDEYLNWKYTLKSVYTRVPLQELFDLEGIESTKKVLMSPSQIKKENTIPTEVLETLLKPPGKTTVFSVLKKPSGEGVC